MNLDTDLVSYGEVNLRAKRQYSRHLRAIVVLQSWFRGELTRKKMTQYMQYYKNSEQYFQNIEKSKFEAG